MPKKLSTHKKIRRFYCPKCKNRLWCLGSSKHFLSYTGISDIQQSISGSRQKTLFLVPEGNCIDTNSWLEEFLCGEHGKLWLRAARQSGGTLSVTLATEEDWLQTIRVIPLGIANLSSSDFTHFISYQTGMENFTPCKGIDSAFQRTNPCLPISEEPVS